MIHFKNPNPANAEHGRPEVGVALDAACGLSHLHHSSPKARWMMGVSADGRDAKNGVRHI